MKARRKYLGHNETPLTKGITMLKNKLNSAKNHVIHYRARYAVATTIVVCGVLHTLQVNEVNKFLAEHNLLDAYYNPEEN
jgi:hypothetical protein